MYLCFIDYYKTFDCVEHNKLGKVLREIGISDHRIKKQRHYFIDKGPYLVKAMVFLVVLYGCESWTIRKPECWRIDAFWIVVLYKTLECPLDCKEIKAVKLKANQSWIIIGKIDAEAETPILWPTYVKNWLFRKDPDAGKDWR